MSFGASQGTVRYALMVDDAQATSAINRFKTNITSLGTPTTNLSKNMGILNNNFKNVSGGLTSTNTLFGQTATQATSLGTKIKATTSQFAGFATGLAVTASGALQLAAGFRDYNDAQIAVERVTRKNSLAHEALTKAQDKLNALTAKGIRSGKAYEAAQLDVSQAQQMVSIQTQLLGEAQERLFDSQTQFAVSIVPVVLGAVGSLGSAFKDLGLNTEKFNGGLSKLKGGLGNLSSSLGMSTKGFLGMSAAIGAAAIAAADLFDLLQKGAEVKALNDIITAGKATTAQLEQQIKNIAEMKKRWDIQIFDFFKSGPIGKAALGDTFAHVGDEVIKSLDSQISRIAARKPLEKLFSMITLSSVPPDAKANIQAQIKHILAILDNTSNWQNPDFTKTSQKIVNDLLMTLGNSIKTASPLTGLTGALRALFVKTFKGVEFTGMTQLFAMDPKPLAKTSQTLIDNYNRIFHAIPPVVNATKTLNEQNKVGADFVQRFADANAIAANKMSDFNIAVTAGQTKFQDFVTSTELANVTNKQYEAGLRSIVGAYVELNPNIDLTTSQLEEMTKSIIEGKGALLAYADIVAKRMAPAVATFRSLLDAKTMKDFNNAFKELDLGKLNKGLGKGLKDAFKPLRDIAERSGEITHLFDAMAVVGGKLSEKNIGKAIKEMAEGFKDMGKTQPLIKEFGNTVLGFVKTAPNMADAWKNVNPVIQKFNELTQDGNLSLDDYNGVMELFNTTIGKTVDPTNKSAAAVKAFGVSSASARGQVDEVTGAIDVLKGQAEKLKPVITILNDKALKAIDAVVKRWQSGSKNIEGEKPKLTIINNTALKAIDAVVKRWQSAVKTIESNKPKITINNTGALREIDAVVKRMAAIKDKTVTVKVNQTGGGGSNLASKANTSGLFVGGSKSDSGSTVIENNFSINVLDETIMRKITSRSGRNRFTMGV